MPDQNQRITSNINELLRDGALGKSELAKLAEISRPQLQRYFAGKNAWPMAKLEKIAKALSVPLARIVGISEAQPARTPTAKEKAALVTLAASVGASEQAVELIRFALEASSIDVGLTLESAKSYEIAGRGERARKKGDRGAG